MASKSHTDTTRERSIYFAACRRLNVRFIRKPIKLKFVLTFCSFWILRLRDSAARSHQNYIYLFDECNKNTRAHQRKLQVKFAQNRSKMKKDCWVAHSRTTTIEWVENKSRKNVHWEIRVLWNWIAPMKSNYEQANVAGAKRTHTHTEKPKSERAINVENHRFWFGYHNISSSQMCIHTATLIIINIHCFRFAHCADGSRARTHSKSFCNL